MSDDKEIIVRLNADGEAIATCPVCGNEATYYLEGNHLFPKGGDGCYHYVYCFEVGRNTGVYELSFDAEAE